jgi:hypothetical protein
MKWLLIDSIFIQQPFHKSKWNGCCMTALVKSREMATAWWHKLSKIKRKQLVHVLLVNLSKIKLLVWQNISSAKWKWNGCCETALINYSKNEMAAIWWSSLIESKWNRCSVTACSVTASHQEMLLVKALGIYKGLAYFWFLARISSKSHIHAFSSLTKRGYGIKSLIMHLQCILIFSE